MYSLLSSAAACDSFLLLRPPFPAIPSPRIPLRSAMGRSRPKSFCSSIASVLLFFFHFDCHFLPHATTSAPLPSSRRSRRKKKISPLVSYPRSPACVVADQTEASPQSSLRSFIGHFFCCFFPQEGTSFHEKIAGDPKSIASSRIADNLPRVVSVKSSSFASRDNVFRCSSLGESFSESRLLDLHQTARRALTELADGDSGLNIVRIIFQSGWKGRGSVNIPVGVRAIPVVHRVLKIQSSPSMLACFEECRESIRSRAAASGNERCMADGNERLRFYCATFLCGLSQDGSLGVCGSPFCSACGIVRRGFGDKDADGVVTYATGWGAHSALPEELEREFAAMNVCRAMLLCRVVAGRVAGGDVDPAESKKANYDSAAVDGVDDVLLVLDSRAVLPCFLIIYSV